LFVERGTVIVANTDYKQVNLKEIQRLHGVQDVERLVPPYSSVDGWGKFARNVLNTQKRLRKWKRSAPCRECKENLQLEKGGRGCLQYCGARQGADYLLKIDFQVL
jgi:hypothetical protein